MLLTWICECPPRPEPERTEDYAPDSRYLVVNLFPVAAKEEVRETQGWRFQGKLMDEYKEIRPSARKKRRNVK